MNPVVRTVKRLLPHSLLGRAILIIVMPLILLQVVSTWVFYDRHWQTITRRLASAVAGETELIMDTMRLSSHTLWRVASSSRSSSLLVPLRKISMAGKILFSARDLDR